MADDSDPTDHPHDPTDPITDDVRWDSSALPSDSDIIAYVQDCAKQGQPSPTKRDIARHFGIKGANRHGLRQALKRLESDGVITLQSKRIRPAGELPPVAVIAIIGADDDGDLFAIPTQSESNAHNHNNTHGQNTDNPPTIYISATSGTTKSSRAKTNTAPKIGDRCLARLERVGNNTYQASIIRVLTTQSAPTIVGIIHADGDGMVIVPTDKKDRNTYIPTDYESHAPKHGDIVIAIPTPNKRKFYGAKQARIQTIIGDMNDPRAFSLIAIHKNGIPTDFADDVLEQTADMTVPPLGNRTDLRHIPLVTIDGADARDFDDAVFAEPWVCDKSGEQQGHHLIVAIADVTHYVTPHTPLDKSAEHRGNSVYFPDRVVPMLPEKLCNDLCSLRPNEPRACLAVHMWIDNNGELQKYKFIRGLMQSHARLTYEQVQQAFDAHQSGTSNATPDNPACHLLHDVIAPLYTAYHALDTARQNRGTLDLDVPERQVNIDSDTGTVQSITPRHRLDSHKLIEEFMVLANVASALALEQKSAPALYRIHEPPTLEKLELLRDGLAGMGYDFAMGNKVTPRLFTGLLQQATTDGKSEIVSDIVLRSQSRAVYTPDNQGHFGLALAKYCHFTSPIRRYADVMVHRALITAYGLSDDPKTDGMPPEQAERLHAIGDHISATEHRAVQAERDALNRYMTAYMADKSGATFTARISGVTSAGLFITLDETGADGLIPLRTLPENDYYILDKNRGTLTGERSGILFALGMRVHATLAEINVASGTMAFTINTDQTDLTRTQTKPKAKPRHRHNRHKNQSTPHKKSQKNQKPDKKKKKTTPKHKRKQNTKSK